MAESKHQPAYIGFLPPADARTKDRKGRETGGDIDTRGIKGNSIEVAQLTERDRGPGSGKKRRFGERLRG